MISALPWNHTIGPSTLVGRISIAALMLSIPMGSARGSQQDRINESRVAVPLAEQREFAGEIEYAFDTALNKTHVRFRAHLGSQSLIARMFTGSPVHTLVVAYEFGGRTPVDGPDSIRLTLESDEYVDGPADYPPMLGSAPILRITFGDSIASLPLGIAQRTEVRPAEETYARVNQLPPGAETRINSYRPVTRVHVERTATARLSVCDLVALANQKNVHGTVAGLDFELSEEVIAGLRQFARGMTPDGAVGVSVRCGFR